MTWEPQVSWMKQALEHIVSVLYMEGRRLQLFRCSTAQGCYTEGHTGSELYFSFCFLSLCPAVGLGVHKEGVHFCGGKNLYG